MTVAIAAGLLVAGAVYLFLQRELVRVALGFVLLAHAANLVLLAAGTTSRRGLPFGQPDPATTADPLPQAFVLTAIVISFSITVVLLALSVTGHRHDDVCDSSDAGTGADDDPAAGQGERHRP